VPGISAVDRAWPGGRPDAAEQGQVDRGRIVGRGGGCGVGGAFLGCPLMLGLQQVVSRGRGG
jgi:hypothetical protein